jgi:hypothetical protein
MKQLTQAEISMPYKPAPMTLGNMRANGVRTLAAWCLSRDCDHHWARDLFLFKTVSGVSALPYDDWARSVNSGE